MTGKLAGIDAAEAPADQAHGAAMPRANRLEAGDERLREIRRWSLVPPELPAVDVIATAAQEPAQRKGRPIAGEPAGDHHHGMTVAAARKLEERQGRN